MSLEASDIWSHMNRDTHIKRDYCGMIPYSLELRKLREEGLKIKYIKSRDKEISNDVINVKFKQKVKSGFELVKIMNKKLSVATEEEYKNKLTNFISYIGQDSSNSRWNEVNVDSLREKLYTEGFVIKFTDRETKKTKEVEYVVYKRSSSKSRTGQCLFIKKSLYNKMIKWSRMDLPFKTNMKVDLAGLLAYESLVGSSLEATIEIDPNKILMVDDVDSKFKRKCNVVRKGESEFLDSFKEETTVSNSLFDGESLLDSKYFEDGISMKLLRNHMFKSAAFNTNIQLFLKDNKPDNIEYDDWSLSDMFGNKIKAKDVELICTPSSLKALKFSHVIGEEKDMWDYWKGKVQEDGNVFGVCKHDKPSKLGTDEQGNVLQQTSYQMINCLPIVMDDVKDLTNTEVNYINRLKNDDDFFMEKVLDSAATINGNEMLYSLYIHNKKIINTELFRNFRKNFIRNHVNHCKKGKIKLNGDYCVLLGNPMEFLYHVIGVDINSDTYTPVLLDNEVHTEIFPFKGEYVGFRNPNTSPSNVLIVKNKEVKDIKTYFNLSDNIVCVNAIKFPIQDILSGCDYDSDTVLLFNDPKMLQLAKECFGEYDVCINHVEGQKKEYRLNKHDMYEIDNQLSTSQRNIGKVVNLGQFCMSVYWDLINKGVSGEKVAELLKKVDVMTILSGIAIDMAKKFYEISIEKEISNVSENELLKDKVKKPKFWKYVSQSKTIRNRVQNYDCPMDFLITELEDLDKAVKRTDIPFEKFLVKRNEKKANRKQMMKVIDRVRLADNLIKSENASYTDEDEKVITIEDVIKECIDTVKKLKIKEDTMYAIIKEACDINTDVLMKLLKVLYETQTETFINAYKISKN